MNFQTRTVINADQYTSLSSWKSMGGRVEIRLRLEMADQQK